MCFVLLFCMINLLQSYMFDFCVICDVISKRIITIEQIANKLVFNTIKMKYWRRLSQTHLDVIWIFDDIDEEDLLDLSHIECNYQEKEK